MNSSISNFKTELKVLLVVLLALGLVEWAIARRTRHGKEYYASMDGEYKRIARAFKKHKAPARVLFMGNSLVNNGINVKVMAEAFKARKLPAPQLERGAFISSAVPEWYYIYKNYFRDKKARPDLLVVCYASDFLRDDGPAKLWHFPYICSAGNLPELLKDDYTRFDQRTELLLGFGMATFRYRFEFRNQFLNGLIPDYKKNVQQLAGANPQPSGVEGGGAVQSAGYDKLRRFLRYVHKQKTPMLVVAMPLRDGQYEVSPKMVEMIRGRGFEFIDCQRIPGISKDHFADYLHLNQAGAQVFSRHLAEVLANRYPEMLAGKTNRQHEKRRQAAVKPKPVLSGPSAPKPLAVAAK